MTVLRRLLDRITFGAQYDFHQARSYRLDWRRLRDKQQCLLYVGKALPVLVLRNPERCSFRASARLANPEDRLAPRTCSWDWLGTAGKARRDASRQWAIVAEFRYGSSFPVPVGLSGFIRAARPRQIHAS